MLTQLEPIKDNVPQLSISSHPALDDHPAACRVPDVEAHEQAAVGEPSDSPGLEREEPEPTEDDLKTLTQTPREPVDAEVDWSWEEEEVGSRESDRSLDDDSSHDTSSDDDLAEAPSYTSRKAPSPPRFGWHKAPPSSETQRVKMLLYRLRGSRPRGAPARVPRRAPCIEYQSHHLSPASASASGSQRYSPYIPRQSSALRRVVTM
ncbi:hypothetical protein M427DRAFT_54583 [Gonapodya prolifera JEL478]|uniref:Uncharacterized protein n=1 Tax=Gonapodya prolifera (strain JEL478) TaxID=1344416 RepID=A0A139ALH9_GONPJ|nr:hypothetical protein M427DRAFT_54583 [Gonapodya prolifera JEL478]|eukprot:KXS17285.1 hypothetical protein M427DRAFT_54583 [Gonapodya prolifera JEL478]